MPYGRGTIRKEQSSPGYLHVGQVPSNCTRQIPQTSSSGISQRQVATACHSLIRTFIVSVTLCDLDDSSCREMKKLNTVTAEDGVDVILKMLKQVRAFLIQQVRPNLLPPTI